MSDFDDLFEHLTDIIGEAIDKIPNGSEIVENIQNSIHFVLDKLNDASIELDDEHRDVLISKLAEALNTSPESISENLDTITLSSESFADKVTENVTDVPIDDSSKAWDGSFQSAGCWDECIASVGEASKRLVCGYHA